MRDRLTVAPLTFSFVIVSVAQVRVPSPCACTTYTTRSTPRYESTSAATPAHLRLEAHTPNAVARMAFGKPEVAILANRDL